MSPALAHFVSACCEGEACAPCLRVGERRPATHKLAEEIFHDDPNPVRHELVAYVCCVHFRGVVGIAATGTCHADHAEDGLLGCLASDYERCEKVLADAGLLHVLAPQGWHDMPRVLEELVYRAKADK